MTSARASLKFTACYFVLSNHGFPLMRLVMGRRRLNAVGLLLLHGPLGLLLAVLFTGAGRIVACCCLSHGPLYGGVNTEVHVSVSNCERDTLQCYVLS